MMRGFTKVKPKRRAAQGACEWCGKTMTLKSLRYSHVAVCPKRPRETHDEVTEPIVEEAPPMIPSRRSETVAEAESIGPVTPKPKAKPRVKKVVAKHMVIDTVDVQPITQETQEPTIVTEPEVVTEAHTTQDTRTPHQRLSDMQQQMKKLRKEAKQVNYKRMLEGKI